MKKIFKLFPVALAVVALASCSSDDLTSVNPDEAQLQLNPDYLYVTVEDNNPVTLTRAAFVSANVADRVQANGNDFFRMLNWTNGDQIKLYSETNNWRTQKWEYDDTETGAQPQYNKSLGFSVFKKAVKVAKHDGEDDGQYTDGYGVMPADLSEFTNEDRTRLAFDLTSMRYINFKQNRIKEDDAAAADATDAAKQYYEAGALNVFKSTAYLPLWGVSKGNVMKCKWLTGHLCVDLVDSQTPIIPATGTTTPYTKHNYLVLQATNKSLWGRFTSIAFDPDDIQKAPIVPATAAAATTIVSGTTKIGDLGPDCIVLNLGGAAYNRIIAYVPVMVDDATPTEVKAYLFQGDASSVYDGDAENVVLTAVGAGTAIATLNEDEIEAGKLYRVTNEDNALIDVANTPYSLQTQLAEIDAKMERDYVVTISNDVLVKTSDTKYEDMASSAADTHNYVLDLSGIEFKHNVTVKFAAGKGFTNNEMTKASDVNYLYVKTKAGKKKLTLELNSVATPADNIKGIVVDNTLGGELILKGTALSDGTQPVAVINHGTAAADGKLTVAAATTSIYTNGAMNIDCEGATVATLNLLDNGLDAAAGSDYTVNLNNGIITNIATLATAAPCDKTTDGDVANNITIASTGLSAITNAPTLTGFATCGVTTHTNHYQKGLFFTSKWDGSKFTSEAQATITSGRLFTAAQLASIDGASSTSYQLMGDIDLDENKWTSVATLTKDFKGADKMAAVYKTPDATTCAKEENKYPTISKLRAPLFNTVALAAAGSIKNFKLSDVQFTSAFAAQGALARTLSVKANVEINNVDAENVTITVTGNKSAVGGLIGNVNSTAATNTLDITSVDVNNITLKGNRKMGGIIGEVATASTSPQLTIGATAATLAGLTPATAKFCTATNVAFQLEESTGIIYDPEYAALGLYVGAFYKTDATKFNMAVNTEDVSSLTYTVTGNDASGVDLFTQKAKYGVSKDGKTIYYDVVLGQRLTGFAVKANNHQATILSLKPSTTPAVFNSFVYSSYATTPAVMPAQYLYYVAE